MTRENPYQRLKRLAQEWHNKVTFRRTVFMFRYGEVKTGTYSLADLFERTKAAEQLGYEVQVKSNGGVLEVYSSRKLRKPHGSYGNDLLAARPSVAVLDVLRLRNFQGWR
jgi:hypothetical protein